MSEFARVSVNIAQLVQAYDYSVPDDLKGRLQPGSLVIVPLGAQTAQGVVIELLDEPSVAKTKSIQALVDDVPAVTRTQIELAHWLAKENLETVSACMDAMLPPGISQHTDILLKLIKEPEDISKLTPTQQRLVRLLQKRGELRGGQVDSAIPHVNWRASLLALQRQLIVSSLPILLPRRVRPKFVRTVSLAIAPDQIEASLESAREGSAKERRRAVLLLLADEALPLNASFVYAETGTDMSDLHWLADRDLIVLGETEIWRDPLEHINPVLTVPPELTPDQNALWQRIRVQIEGQEARRPNLITGVTGSGKTEIYLRSVQATLDQGRQALIMVPEISLTPQTVRRFYSRFPGKVGLVHSKLSPGERYDTWRRVRSGELRVVVGPRSALFSPFGKLGLIVIDECHDGSYHQAEFHPFYNSIDTALEYARLTDSVIMLGSATPDVELQYRADRNEWNRLALPKRIFAHRNVMIEQGGTNLAMGDDSLESLPLPPVTIVDMRQELKAGNRSALSRLLTENLHETLERKQQAILFLNRRGSASHVFCRDCGTTLRCPRCDSPLTFHADIGKLVCHICNYRRNMPTVCPVCGSVNIRQFGLGTESLEKMVVAQFPGANVLRWDSETARLKGAHDLIMDHFISHRADILIGTQMLAKGLDLPLVTLVGAVLADVSLNLPDFRAPERTFQLLTQLAGRAGRSPLGGKVVFQTFHPENYAIQAAANHDLESFTAQELVLRKQAGYPPYSRMVKIEFRSRKEEEAENAAQRSAQLFEKWIEELGMTSTSLIGPVPCFYSRMNGVYRWMVIARGPDPRKMFTGRPLAEWQPHGVDVEITVDPDSML